MRSQSCLDFVIWNSSFNEQSWELMMMMMMIWWQRSCWIFQPEWGLLNFILEVWAVSWALKKSSQFNISLPFAWCLVQTLYRGMTGRFSHHNSDKEERRDKGFTKQFFPSFYVCILLRYEEYKISGIIRPQFCDRMFPVFVRHLISDLISAVLQLQK